MKKNLLLTLLLALLSLSTMAMSRTKIRNNARFLTDRMAYELDFTPMQYDDCYEINYDFIAAVSYLMDDVVRGYYDAINAYYRYLDYRNDDLRYIMTTSQYIRFMARDYFYRPIYTSGSSWQFRIYTTYSNTSFFYFNAPTAFREYRGGHSRSNFATGFYANRYTGNDHFTGRGTILGSQNFNTHRTSDFGTNLRDRNQKPDYNNYGNRNSANRESDPRYRTTNNNQNTPLINQRTPTGEHRGATPATTTQRTPAGGSRTPATTTSREARGSRSTTGR